MTAESDIGRRRGPAAGRIVVDVQHDAGDWSAAGDVERIVRDAADALARHGASGPGVAEACVALSDDAQVAELNRRFRGKDKATNVLSFPAPPTAAAPDDGARPLGDVILAAETVLAEAGELGIPTRHHLQHLIVHGLLHLLGHDHEDDAGARRMEALEVEILATLGVPDPYRIAAEADAG